MPYIGNKPGAKYATLTRQTFSSPTGTSHTLSQTVTNSDDLLLYINNVKQNPADYTASGTTLTTASLASGTEMYCLYYGKTTETVAVPSDSVDSSHIVDDAIDSEHYTDGSIDNVHLATGIDASKLTTGTLPIARIADDAITLAKMASGTDGQIITYDASGNPVAVGPGTDGQVLTSTGAGSPPAFEAVPSVTDIKFSACLASDHSNVTGDGTGWHSNDSGISWSTPIINSGSGFSGGLFTVPTGGAGTYLFSFHSWMAGLSSSHTEAYGYIRTSNRYYEVYHGNPYASYVGANASQSFNWQTIADMDVGDVAYVRMAIYNGAKTVDMRGTGSFDYADTYFQGVLLA